jgi:hypothetical protein
MTMLPYGICIIGIMSVVMLGLGLRQIRPQKKQIQLLLGVDRIRMLVRGLLVGPILVVIGLAGVLIFVFRDSYLLRLSHGAFVFGLWIILIIAFFALALISRLNIRPDVQTLSAPVLAVPLVAYLTPIERFQDVFSTVSPLLPLIVGLGVVSSGYFLIWQVYRELVG